MEIDSRRIRRLIRQNRAKERTLDRIVRRQGWLDPLAEAVQTAVGAFYEVLGAPGKTLKDAVHGTHVFGHPLHPALTDVPIGAWTVAVLADGLVGAAGRVPAVAGRLVMVRVAVAALPAVALGVAGLQWPDG